MKQLTWLHWILAAVIVVAGGAVLAFADGDGEVRKMVKVNVNGDVDSLELEDLADGETRTFDAGEHTVTVTRDGDELSVLLDGEPLGGPGGEHMVWVTEDELLKEGDGGARRVMIVKKHGEGEGEVRTITIHAECDHEDDDCEKLAIDVESLDEIDINDLEGHPHAMVMTSGDGAHPMIVKTRATRVGMVRYRCEETGSELLVKQEDATADSYVCPATGCVMERVTEPEVKVIKVMHRVETSDGDDD